MRTFILIFLACFLIIHIIKADTNNNLFVSIAVPIENGMRKIEYNEKNMCFYVVIINKSSDRINLWSPYCSWGYFCLKFEIIVSGKRYSANKRVHVFKNNYPAFFTLLPKDTFVIPIYYTSDEWEGFNILDKNNYSKVRMRVQYTARPCTDNLDNKKTFENVWIGEIYSEWDEYIFSRTSDRTP